MLTKEIYKAEPKKERVARDDPRTVSELKRLDEEIVKLRTKHDKLHDSNQRKRTELNLLADKLKDLHSGSYSAEASPQIKLKEGEEQLLGSAARYEEEHKLKLTQRRTSDAKGPTPGRRDRRPGPTRALPRAGAAAAVTGRPERGLAGTRTLPPLPPPADPRLTPSPLLPPGCTACCSAGTSR